MNNPVYISFGSPTPCTPSTADDEPDSDMDLEIIDEYTVRGEELEKQTYLEEEHEFQEGDVEALMADDAEVGGGADGGNGGDQPEAMDGDDEDSDMEDDVSMAPTDPPVLVDMEVREKTLAEFFPLVISLSHKKKLPQNRSRHSTTVSASSHTTSTGAIPTYRGWTGRSGIPSPASRLTSGRHRCGSPCRAEVNINGNFPE